MVDSSVVCSTRRSISVIRSWARTLAVTMWRCNSFSHSCSSGVAAGTSCCPSAVNQSGIIWANSRSVGVSMVSRTLRSLPDATGNVSHGASNASSSRVLRICRVRAWAHHRASPSGNVAGTVSKMAVTSAAEFANRASQDRDAASVPGGSSQTDSRSFRS